MIITLIIVFATIILFIIDAIVSHKKGGSYYTPYSESELALGISKWLGVIIFAGLLLSILIVNCPLAVESDRIECQEEYKAITAAIEKEDNIILLTSEISEYNGKILKRQKFHSNPWVNWFFNGAYEDMPLIEVGKETE